MQLVLELLKKIFVALHGNASSIATNTTNIATNTESLDYIKARVASIPGGACVMFVDIPEDDGANEYWGDDAVNFARVYEVVLPKVDTGGGSASVDWGDGSSDAITQSTADYVRHKYMSPGRYWIVLSGNVVAMSAVNNESTYKDPAMSASYAAGIGIVSLTINALKTIAFAFESFSSLGEVYVRLTNATSVSYAFQAIAAESITAELGSAYCNGFIVWASSVKSAKIFNGGTQSINYAMYGRYLKDAVFAWEGELFPERVFYPAGQPGVQLTNVTLLMPNLKRFAAVFSIAGKSSLTHFGAGLPSLVNGDGLFENTNLDKPSVLRLLNALPDRTGVEPEREGDGVITFTSTVATAAINNIDADIQAAIDAAEAKGWTVEV